MATADTQTTIKPKLTLKEPNKFKVIYVNDNVTTIDFVVDSLVSIFMHDTETAEAIAGHIHELGSAVVAVLPYEMAEQKGVEATQLARDSGFPLLIKLEEDK